MGLEIPDPNLPHIHSGKVRESYELGPDHLLVVASDRISVYDVVMAEPIPNKGRILTAMSNFWRDEIGGITPTDRTDKPPEELAEADLSNPYFKGRVTTVKRAKIVPIEAIVRAHLTGSAWKEYQENGTVHGMAVPQNMQESEAFPVPMFTPSTKAEEGHDENITFDQSVEIAGYETMEWIREVSLRIFQHMYERAEEGGVTLADTKFEFGRLGGRILALCDEIGTPDSSRFWPTDEVRPGEAPPSFDKQYVRDYAASTGWNKEYPPPPLPAKIIEGTRERYKEAFERITGRKVEYIPGFIK